MFDKATETRMLTKWFSTVNNKQIVLAAGSDSTFTWFSKQSRMNINRSKSASSKSVQLDGVTMPGTPGIMKSHFTYKPQKHDNFTFASAQP